MSDDDIARIERKNAERRERVFQMALMGMNAQDVAAVVAEIDELIKECRQQRASINTLSSDMSALKQELDVAKMVCRLSRKEPA